MSKFCVEVLTKDFGLAREAIFIVDRDHLAEQVADIVAISPHVACTVSRAPAEALITPEWPSFLAGLTEHLRGPRIDLPNPERGRSRRQALGEAPRCRGGSGAWWVRPVVSRLLRGRRQEPARAGVDRAVRGGRDGLRA